MTLQPCVLIVDDEPDLVAVLKYNLEKEGYSTRTALTGKAALREMSIEPLPDLVLLDLMLPDISGIEVCRRIRTEPRISKTLILMLTAKGEEIDRVIGFEVGADDYVVKPFSVRELMLRIQAILKRTVQGESNAETIEFGSLRINVPAHRVSVEGKEIALTALEFKLLTTLVERKGRVQTRDTLLEDVWEMSAEVTTRTVDTHVKRLREKLGAAGDYIETVRGVGYRCLEELDKDRA